MRTTICNISVPYYTGPIEVQADEYRNGTTAIVCIDPTTGETVAIPTVNLAADGELPATGHVFVGHDDAEMGAALEQAGILSAPIREIPYGPFDAVATERRLLTGSLTTVTQ